MAMERRTRILIVDDSAVMRSLLRGIVGAEPALEVAGTAADGESALKAVSTLRPDLVLLDVEMPVMDGLATLRRLRSIGYRAPVIMCSSLTQRGGRVTIEALASGASDYVAKPSGQAGREAAQRTLAQELIPKIRALTQRFSPTPLAAPPALLRPAFPAMIQTSIAAEPAVVVIGVSTGGPAALDMVLPALPAQFPLPVLVVQHMPELFTGLLAERLNGRCRMRIREAVEGEAIRAGTVTIARGNWHLEIVTTGRSGTAPTMHLTQAAPENHCRPAADVLFRSAATVYGSGVLAVVLTGMGSDGLAGCRAVRSAGGAVLAQDQATSAVWGMPGAVVAAGLAQRVLPLEAVAPEILRIAGRSRGDARELRETVA